MMGESQLIMTDSAVQLTLGSSVPGASGPVNPADADRLARHGHASQAQSWSHNGKKNEVGGGLDLSMSLRYIGFDRARTTMQANAWNLEFGQKQFPCPSEPPAPVPHQQQQHQGRPQSRWHSAVGC